MDRLLELKKPRDSPGIPRIHRISKSDSPNKSLERTGHRGTILLKVLGPPLRLNVRLAGKRHRILQTGKKVTEGGEEGIQEESPDRRNLRLLFMVGYAALRGSI